MQKQKQEEFTKCQIKNFKRRESKREYKKMKHYVETKRPLLPEDLLFRTPNNSQGHFSLFAPKYVLDANIPVEDLPKDNDVRYILHLLKKLNAPPRSPEPGGIWSCPAMDLDDDDEFKI